MSRTNIKRNLIAKLILIVVGIPLLCMIAFGTYLYFEINRTNGEIITSGDKRTYLIYVPNNYQPETPSPLVICFHGFAQWPAHQMQVSQWNQIADENDFIVVYPSGTGFPRRWETNSQNGTTADIQFISDLIDQIKIDYNIDDTRIYVNGLSNGGGMSFSLACNLSERIAAIGSVAGAYLTPWEACNPKRPVPAIIFHGTNDPIVPFEGGLSTFSNFPFPEIPGWVKTLAAQNGCAANPIELPFQGEITGKKYIDCAQNSEVLFYIINGGGHSWPGGGYLPERIVGYTTHAIDATRIMWDFFQEHRIEK